MAKRDDLIAAKDALFSSLLHSRGSTVAIRPTRIIPDTRVDDGRDLHAVGVGRKIVNGKRTGALCVRLYVVRKLAKSLIPRAARLPKSIAGIPTDVIEMPVARIHLAPQPLCARYRRKSQAVLIGGISAAHQAATGCTTFGCFCRSTARGEGGRMYMLGSNHGFANVNAGTAGDAIRQPSPAEPGASGNRVAGRLARFVPIQMGYSQNRVDAAIAQVDARVRLVNEICTIGHLTGVAQAVDGMIVCKHGRTTGYTEGTVDDASLSAFVVDYPGGAFATFVNQIKIVPTLGYQAPPGEMQWDGWFAADGDSGSVIVEKGTRRAIGLHFAGAYGIGVANPMTDVCSLLKIMIP